MRVPVSRRRSVSALMGAAAVAALTSLACEHPAEPPEPVYLDDTYFAVMSAFGPLPVRFDHLLDPPDSGEWWVMWMEEVTITFARDGTYELIQVVKDSFPRSSDTAYRQWRIVGTYEVRDDTILSFEIDQEESFSKIGLTFGRVRANNTLWTDMFGFTYHERE